MAVDWHGKAVRNEVGDICYMITQEQAKAVARDARKYVPVDTGGLKRSIRVKSFKKDGVVGTYVKAGEKDKGYIAAFVELGTPGTEYKRKYRKGQKRTPIKAQSFLRKALKKNKTNIKRAFENRLKK